MIGISPCDVITDANGPVKIMLQHLSALGQNPYTLLLFSAKLATRIIMAVYPKILRITMHHYSERSFNSMPYMIV
jgi:hypothetical protein